MAQGFNPTTNAPINVPDVNASVAGINQASAKLGINTGRTFQRLTPLDAPTAPTVNTSGISAPALPQGYQAAKDATAVKTPEQIQADARTQAMSGVQDRINAVNQVYNAEAENQGAVNRGNMARTNAISAVSGLAGSTAADARTAGSADAGARSLRSIESQRNSAIQSIYGQVDQNAMKLSQAALQANNANAEAMIKDVSSSATALIQKIATTVGNNGATWQQFKEADPELAQSLSKQSGKSDATLELLWNDGLPQAAKSDYVWQSGLAFQYSPTSGQMIRRPELDTTPVSEGASKVMSVGGTLFNFPIDARGNTVIDPNKSINDYIFKGSTQEQFKSSTTKSSADPVAAFGKSLSSVSSMKASGTREQFIRQLQAQYPEIHPDDIKAAVYNTYPDNWEKTTTSTSGSTPSSSGKRVLPMIQ